MKRKILVIALKIAEGVVRVLKDELKGGNNGKK
jgi:hypothetical protein